MKRSREEQAALDELAQRLGLVLLNCTVAAVIVMSLFGWAL